MTNPRNISSVKEPKKEPDMIWNNRSITAYTDLGLEVPENVCRFERQFLSKVDVTKGPIERTIVAMVRLKAPDILGQEKNKLKVPDRKEFIYYQERWEGLNWRNVPLNPVAEHYKGRYDRQFTKPHINQQNGEIEYMELDVGKHQTIYYIPFSKKTVDDLIAKSAHSDQNNIRFTIKFDSEDSPWGPRPATRNQFSYEQFANWKWDDIYKFNFKPTVQAYNNGLTKISLRII